MNTINDPLRPGRVYRKSDSGISRHEAIVARVTGMAHQRRYLVHYCGSSLYCAGRGLPDLIIVTPRGVIFAEIKVDSFSKVSPEQTTWKHALLACGANYVCWYESDLESGVIESALDAAKLEPIRSGNG